jgi:response regulator of citrate/malate metabolism
MAVRVLVADNDSDMHELVNDILHINFKDVVVERVQDWKGFCAKIRTGPDAYDLILLDGYQTDTDGRELIDALQEEFPEMLRKVIMICGAASDCRIRQDRVPVPCLVKPFSLDDFGEIVKRICVV